MTTAETLDASVTRLEQIKGDKQLRNKNKIAEAEALAAEALRMANEAKLAAARLAEVKKTLSMFSNKLEKAEQSVHKDVKVEKPVVEETEDSSPADPPAPEVEEEGVSEEVKVVEEVEAPPAVIEAPVAPESELAVVEEPAATPAPIVVQGPTPKYIVEDFLDGLGIDKMCGLDDEALGFTDREPKPAPQPTVFVNPTRMEYKTLSNEELLHGISSKESSAALQRAMFGMKEAQRSNVNEEFVDPFGVDHDDLVFCGKLADTCEPVEYVGEGSYEEDQ